jgi:hypothetical protein
MGTVLKLAAGGLVVALAGCANLVGPSQQQLTQQAMANAQATCRSLLTDPRIDGIRSKIPDAPMDATFDQLSNTSKPTAEELPAVKARAEAFLKCAAAYREAYIGRSAPAPYLNAHDISVNRLAGLYAALVGQEITFGQFMRQGQEQVLARQKAFQDLDAAYRAQSQADADRALRNYQLIQSLQPARPITCYRAGAYTTCQ